MRGETPKGLARPFLEGDERGRPPAGGRQAQGLKSLWHVAAEGAHWHGGRAARPTAPGRAGAAAARAARPPGRRGAPPPLPADRPPAVAGRDDGAADVVTSAARTGEALRAAGVADVVSAGRVVAARVCAEVRAGAAGAADDGAAGGANVGAAEIACWLWAAATMGAAAVACCPTTAFCARTTLAEPEFVGAPLDLAAGVAGRVVAGAATGGAAACTTGAAACTTGAATCTTGATTAFTTGAATLTTEPRQPARPAPRP